MLRKRIYSSLFIIGIIYFFIATSVSAAGTVYYVSSSEGHDTNNNGLSAASPFATIAKVNSLNLQPGDSVLFKCGDSWRAESLVITESGTAGNPITFGSYPANCPNKPLLSGAQPISGWAVHAANIYVADLAAGANAGKFPAGINQLFQNSTRLPMGRWPNLNANNNGGYSTIDAHAGNNITDNALPAGNWTGAQAHIKGMRWYILNRAVTNTSGKTLTLGVFPDCWSGSCQDWGYFINNHLGTLDQNGEWYYDQASNRVYLYTTGGTPTNIEGSVVIDGADVGFHGGIIIGQHLYNAIHYVTIDNLAVSRWFDNGITTPRNLETEDNSHLIIRKVDVHNVDKAGIFFMTWIWNAGANSGWRGGRNLLVENSLIDGANHTGINTYAVNSTYRDNVLRNIGLIENVGKDGLGCAANQGGGFCTRDGVGIRVPIDKPAFTGFGNTFQYNRLEKIGHSGIQIFGANNTVEYNVFQDTGYAKGDNGAILIFGGNGFANSQARDITIRRNIVLNPIGNTDGAAPFFKPLFSAGIYVDNYSDNITVADNTVVGATIDGILFQNSRGSITGNTLYNNNAGTMSRGQIGLYFNTIQISSMSNNVLYGLNRIDAFTFAKTLHTENANASDITAADNNYYFNPYRSDNISLGFNLQTLPQWQGASGLDANSKANWFNLNPADSPRSQIFYNDTKNSQAINLGNSKYLDLDQNEVTGSLMLAPFTSKVLIDSGEVALAPAKLYFDTAGGPAQAVVLKNITGASLQINAITVSTGFNQSNNCPATLAVGETCTINVTFSSAAANPVEGTLSVTHNAGSAYTVDLVGGLLKTFLPILTKN